MMDVVIHDLANRVESGFDLSDEEMRVIVEEICPYWRDKAFWDDLYKALPKATRDLTYNPKNPVESRHILDETASYLSLIHI